MLANDVSIGKLIKKNLILVPSFNNFFSFRSLWQYFMIVENYVFSSWEIQAKNSKNKWSFGGFQLLDFKENKKNH
jgi:hypothetical protein